MKVTKTQAADPERVKITNVDRGNWDANLATAESTDELNFDLGLWIRGLENFCSIGRRMFTSALQHSNLNRNYRNEFQITHAILIRCGELIEELGLRAKANQSKVASNVGEVHQVIKNLAVSNSAFARNPSLNFAEWSAWCEIISDRLERCEIYHSFDRLFEERGFEFLPAQFRNLFSSQILTTEDRADFERLLPRLGGILRSLEVVRLMLSADRPLKPALAIFAFTHEVIDEVILDINERLAVRKDESSEIFAMLDAVSYTLMIESRKVYSQELGSVIGIRSATAVFARIEAAFGLLNDNIRQLLAGFLRIAEPGVKAAELFPEFNEKLEHSLVLRSELWTILSKARSAESGSAESDLESLRLELTKFLNEPIRYLFYKDRETFERFCNEIAATRSIDDAGPILHRFSAYVETLYSQVGMRALLSNHPFSPESSSANY